MGKCWVQVIHELESSSGTPGKMKRPLKGVAKEDIICRVRLQESTLDLNAPGNALPVFSVKVLGLLVESLDIRNNISLEHVRLNLARSVRIDEMRYWDKMSRVWASKYS